MRGLREARCYWGASVSGLWRFMPGILLALVLAGGQEGWAQEAEDVEAASQEFAEQETLDQEAASRESQGESTAAEEEQGKQASEACTACLTWKSPLVIVQILWMILVTVGAALYSQSIGKKNGEVINEKELRGLNLPRGSLRGILALATIGSFVNVMVLGAPVLGDSFSSVLAAFGTLTGSIVGFYFGTRGATQPPT